MAQNVDKFPTQKDDLSPILHGWELDVAASKELEAIQGNAFFI